MLSSLRSLKMIFYVLFCLETPLASIRGAFDFEISFLEFPQSRASMLRLVPHSAGDCLVEFAFLYFDAHIFVLLVGGSLLFLFLRGEPEFDSVLVSVLLMGRSVVCSDVLVGSGPGAEFLPTSLDGTGSLFLFAKLFWKVLVVPISRPQVFLYTEKVMEFAPTDDLSLYGHLVDKIECLFVLGNRCNRLSPNDSKTHSRRDTYDSTRYL
jgi:hypothetical protein